MSSVIDFVLDGLERALELERELGVRSVECDRSLLAEGRETRVESRETRVERPVAPPSPRASSPESSPAKHDLVFLHDRPLSDGGVEMMAKIVTALGRTSETAPIVVVPPAPKKPKVVVVLGARALKLYFPEVKGEPGQWFRTAEGQDVLITYSPEYFLRFATVTPVVQQHKKDMWRSLKAVVQRLG